MITFRGNETAPANQLTQAQSTMGDVDALPATRPPPPRGLKIFHMDALGPPCGRSDNYPPQREVAVMFIRPSQEWRCDLLNIPYARLWTFPAHRHVIQNCGTKRAEWVRAVSDVFFSPAMGSQTEISSA